VAPGLHRLAFPSVNPTAFLRGLALKARGPGSLTLATTIAGQVFTTVTGIIAARALGVDGRGTLALLWLVPVVITLIGGVGIAPATTYFVAREPDHVRSIVSKSIRILVLLGAVLAAGYALGLVLLSGSDPDYSRLEGAFSVALIPVILGQNLGIATLLGLERFRAYNGARLMPVFGYMVLAGLLYAVSLANLTSIMLVVLCAWGVALLITWTLLARSLTPETDGSDATSRDIVSFGLRGVIGSVSPIDDVRADQFIVGLMLDARALGLYVTAIAFCNLPRFIALSFGAIAYPRIAAAHEPVRAWKLVAHYLRLGLPAVAVCAFGVFAVLPLLIPLFFGEEFRDAIPIGRILLVGALFLAVHRLLTEIARGLGHPGFGSISEVVNGLVFLLGVFAVSGALTTSDVAWSVVAGGVASVVTLSWLVFRLWRRDSALPPSP